MTVHPTSSSSVVPPPVPTALPVLRPGRDNRAYVRSNAGFTMIELLAYMVIVGLMLFLLIAMTYRSARQTAKRRETVAAAMAYGEAIEAFRLAHAAKIPVWGAADGWPTAEGGPVDSSVTPVKVYLRGGVPEVVSQNASTPDFAAEIKLGGGPKAKGGSIIYTTVGTWQYELASYWNNTYMCSIGNAPSVAVAGKKRCA